MKVHLIRKKTDNANLAHKIFLRIQATANLEKLRVLDLYAGNNTIWNSFNCERYYGIEQVKGKGRNLHATNIKVIPNLNLESFNVIDADAYGTPYEQVELIFENKTLARGSVIIYTSIVAKLSSLTTACVEKNNLQKINKKARTLTALKTHELFYAMLAGYGISEVYKYEEYNQYVKHYGYFYVK